MSENLREFILLLACHAPWGELLLSRLSEAGFLTVWASNVIEMRAALTCSDADLLIVDSTMLDALPGGIACPVIALLDDISPAAVACTLREQQATVCLPSPPDPDVLVVQTERLLACGAVTDALPISIPSSDSRRSDRVAVWQLDTTAWELHSPCRARIDLTQREASFMAELADLPGKPVTRQKLIVAMGYELRAYDYRRLDTFVSRLRNKIAKQTSVPLPLRCIHAYGYSFAGKIVKTDG